MLWTAPITGADSDHPTVGPPEPFLRTEFNQSSPSISPDGRWLAYESNETGDYEIFCHPLPGFRRQMARLHWRRARRLLVSKGGRLFYKNGNAIILADCPAHGDTLLPGKPRAWAARGGNRMYAVAPDESRAVVVESEAAKSDSQVFFGSGVP